MEHQARLALMTNETPVGCVLVHNGRVIAKGMNATNITRNGTRHAELMAISALVSFEPQPVPKAAPQAPASEARRRKRAKRRALANKTNDAADAPPVAEEETAWGSVDPGTGYLYPYGQKLHPSPRVDPSIISECVLYVTVEPCVMCASLLRQLRIKKVYFGAVNDKFGGTGGVFRIHMNAHETVAATVATAPPSPRLPAADENTRPSLQHRSATCNGEENADSAAHDARDSEFHVPQRAMHEQTYLGGHGGNVEPGFEAEGGWGRDEAVTLLRQFYVQENGRGKSLPSARPACFLHCVLDERCGGSNLYYPLESYLLFIGASLERKLWGHGTNGGTAPIPRKKEGRAARLAVMLERDGHAGGPMIQTLPGEEGTSPSSPSTSATEPITPIDAMAGGGLSGSAIPNMDAVVTGPV
jgi:tRNA(Arg) A34 adenosine deaminase TadA